MRTAFLKTQRCGEHCGWVRGPIEIFGPHEVCPCCGSELEYVVGTFAVVKTGHGIFREKHYTDFQERITKKPVILKPPPME